MIIVSMWRVNECPRDELVSEALNTPQEGAADAPTLPHQQVAAQTAATNVFQEV